MRLNTTNDMSDNKQPKKSFFLKVAFALCLFSLSLFIASAEVYTVNNAMTPPGGVIDPSIVSINQDGYNWEVVNNTYTARFKNGFNWGDSIYFTAGQGGHHVILSPINLRYRDHNDADQFVTSSAGATIQLTDDTVTYVGAFGTGRDVRYTILPNQLKEDLILQTRSALPNPQQWFINNAPNGEVFFEMMFQVKITADIVYEGTTRTTPGGYTATNGTIAFTHPSTGEVLYRITEPIAVDSDGTVVLGEYFVRPQSGEWIIGIRIPYAWLDTASYPVRIDPTFEVDYSPIPARHLIEGIVTTTHEPDFNTVNDITAIMSDGNISTSVNVARNVRTVTSYDAFDSVGGTNINAPLATAGDSNFVNVQLGGLSRAMQVIPSSPVTQNSRLVIDMRPANSPSQNQVVSITDPTGTVTYATFNTGSSASFTRVIPQLNNIPPGGVSDLRLFIVGGGGGLRVEYDFLEVQRNIPSQGRAVSGYWTQTYVAEDSWFLRVYKPTTGTHAATVFAYDDEENISSTFVTANLAGSGWFNIPIDSLMEYQTDNTALGATKLRYYTEEESTISQLLLRREGNDTTPPVITNCAVGTTTLFDGENTSVSCEVTDNIDVANVTATFGSENIVLEQITNSNTFTYTYFCEATGNDQVNNWNNVNATDIVGNSATQNPALTVTCRRHCDYTGSGPWNLFKALSCTVSEAVTGLFTDPIVSGGGVVTVFDNNITGFTALEVADNSTFRVVNGTSVRIGGE